MMDKNDDNTAEESLQSEVKKNINDEDNKEPEIDFSIYEPLKELLIEQHRNEQDIAEIEDANHKHYKE